MESTDSSTGSHQQPPPPPPQPQLPPGFRFHPTDEELVVHYLKKKASSTPLPVAIIADVDLYKFDPWELPAKAAFGEQEWYFFSPRDRKYPNGARPNRAATSGYWKATGTDKPILTSGGTQKVGVKKALVFYGGKPPKGIKTNWIMHEYRLIENRVNNKPPGCDYGNKRNSLRLDDWVLCRIYKKNNTSRTIDHEKDESMEEMIFGHISPSLNVGHHNAKMNLQKATNYTSLFDNDQNLFDGMMNNDGTISQLPSSGSNPANSYPLKRTIPSLYWHDDDESTEPATSKRFLGENNGNSSISTLLSQLPQTPPLQQQQQQQAMLGSLRDGFFGHHINFLA